MGKHPGVWRKFILENSSIYYTLSTTLEAESIRRRGFSADVINSGDIYGNFGR